MIQEKKQTASKKQRIFITRDIGIATYLSMRGHRLQGLDVDEEKSHAEHKIVCRFLFDIGNKSIDETVSEWLSSTYRRYYVEFRCMKEVLFAEVDKHKQMLESNDNNERNDNTNGNEKDES